MSLGIFITPLNFHAEFFLYDILQENKNYQGFNFQPYWVRIISDYKSFSVSSRKQSLSRWKIRNRKTTHQGCSDTQHWSSYFLPTHPFVCEQCFPLVKHHFSKILTAISCSHCYCTYSQMHAIILTILFLQFQNVVCTIVSSRIVEEVEEVVLQSGVLHLLFLKLNTKCWVLSINKWDREMIYLINCLPHKREVLSLIPSIHIEKLT